MKQLEQRLINELIKSGRTVVVRFSEECVTIDIPSYDGTRVGINYFSGKDLREALRQVAGDHDCARILKSQDIVEIMADDPEDHKLVDLTISHDFFFPFRADLDNALNEAVKVADGANEVVVTGQIVLECTGGGTAADPSKRFMPAKHKVKLNIKKEQLQLSGLSHGFIAHQLDDRILLTDPDDDQMRISDLMK